MTLLLVAMVLPLALLGLMLGMERVERPLRRASVTEQLESFLDSARPEEVEAFISEGFAPAAGRLLEAPALRAPAARPSPVTWNTAPVTSTEESER